MLQTDSLSAILVNNLVLLPQGLTLQLCKVESFQQHL